MKVVALTESVCAPVEQAPTCDSQFASLIHRQSRFVFRVAHAVLRNSHDAEDVVQETFLKLYRSGKWTAMVDERAFLARAAWRIAVDRRPRPTPNPQLNKKADNPEQAMLSGNRIAIIHGLIDALPEELRQALTLSGMEDLNSKEIAVILGISDGTVRTRLMRARQILRQKLAAIEAGPHAR